jgi:phage shock protein PspC (stress-responsive transcriptional regulator)
MEQRTGLYRHSKDSMIAGVAVGIAQSANIDVTIIRIAFVLLALFGGSGIFIYAIMWIVLPQHDETVFTSNNSQNMEEEKKQEKGQTSPFSDQNPKYKRKDDGSLIAGIILISLGVIFLVMRYFPRIDFSDLWPVILIAVGIVLLRNAFVGKK